MDDAARPVAATAPGSPAFRKLTVLLVTPTLDAGAPAAGVFDLVGTLSRAGHRAIVASRRGERVAEVQALGGEWVPLDVASVNPGVIVANAWRMARIVRQNAVDLIHAHGRAGAWSALAAARATDRPLVTTWHKGFREQNVLKHLYNGVMARGDRVIAASEQIAALVATRYRNVENRLSTVPVPVDAMAFDPAGVTPERIAAVRTTWGVAPGTRVLLVAGRMLPRKGHHVVVEAAQALKALGLRDFVCVLASPDAGTRYAGELWDRVLADGTADVVRLAGPMHDMPAVYAASCAVISAAVQPEGAQRVILEAQAMARPVIVSDLGAGGDLVLAPPAVSEDKMTGLRSRPDDAAELGTLVLRLLSMTDADRAAMGARGRAWVSNRFKPEAVAERMLALYAAACRPPKD